MSGTLWGRPEPERRENEMGSVIRYKEVLKDLRRERHERKRIMKKRRMETRR